MIKELVFIACGGAIGSVLRFITVSLVYGTFGRAFPYGTLAVNVSGSFLIGLLSVLLLEKFSVSAEWRAAVIIGFLGAFTTFSTFSLETLYWIQEGEPVKAGLNILISVFGCLLAVWLGFALGKQFL